MAFTITFIKLFLNGIVLVSPLLLLLLLIVAVIGQIVGKMERWSKFEALYWAFITASTVGYGDIRPLRKRSRIMAVFIALFGILFTGLLVAIAVETASISFKEHIIPGMLQ